MDLNNTMLLKINLLCFKVGNDTLVSSLKKNDNNYFSLCQIIDLILTYQGSV